MGNKPYYDADCACHAMEQNINDEFSNCSWNCDEACAAWTDRSQDLKDNGIEFEAYSDEMYGCTCPTCGRMVCGWCV